MSIVTLNQWTAITNRTLLGSWNITNRRMKLEISNICVDLQIYDFSNNSEARYISNCSSLRSMKCMPIIFEIKVQLNSDFRCRFS